MSQKKITLLGIYRPKNPDPESMRGHCVKLIGWGIEKDGEGGGESAYWTYMNSWGRPWGENGNFSNYFKLHEFY